MTDRPALPILAVATTLLLWASAFVGIRYLGDDFSPGALSLGRLLVATVALTAVSVSREVVRPTAGEWRSLIIIGVLWFAVYNVALNAGERRVDAGTAALLIQVSPVLIALFAALFLGERFTRWLGAGLTLAFAGVAMIGLGAGDGASADVIGVGLCLVAALSYSAALILQKPLVARMSAIQVTWLACVIGAIACLPFAPALAREVAAAPVNSTLWLAYLGLFPTAIAFSTFAYALRHIPAGRLGVTTYLVPPITIVLGLVFLGETPPTAAYLGGVLALAGVAIARR